MKEMNPADRERFRDYKSWDYVSKAWFAIVMDHVEYLEDQLAKEIHNEQDRPHPGAPAGRFGASSEQRF